MTALTVVLAHQGGWDEMLFVLVPLLVFLTLQWLNRRKMRQQGDDGQKRGEQGSRRGRATAALRLDGIRAAAGVL